MIRRRPRSRQLTWFVAFSVAVHLALAALMLVGPQRIAIAVPDEQPTLEFRMVQQEGAGPSTAPPVPQPTPDPPTAKPAAAPPPAPKADPKPTPPPVADAEPIPTPPPPAPPAPPAKSAEAAPPAAAAPAPASAQAAPQINLGGTDSLSSLIATGDQLVPPAIDSKIHNQEPIYPKEAVRLRQHGAVLLMVQIAPDGSVARLEIPQSSGFPMLDAAARDAVSTWHFRPAIKEGQGVASEMPVRIQFTLN